MVRLMLLGRDSEIDSISTLLDDARAGRGGALLLSGAAGIGKTMLLTAAMGMASGFTLLRATGQESEASLAFGGLVSLLRPLRARIGGLPPPQGAALSGALAYGPPVPSERLAVAAATLGLVTGAAEEQPLLMVVDDLHWLDPSSAEAVLFTARRLGSDRVAILMSARAEEESVVDSSGLDRMDLGGLDAPAAAALLARTDGPPVAPAVVAELLARTAGNPLALIEATSALDDRQRAGIAPIGELLPVGAGIEMRTRRRLGGLPEATRTALTTLAAAGAGPPDKLAEAWRTLGVGPDDLLPAERAGLVHGGTEAEPFPHPLTRSAILAAADGALLRRAHRALADALARDPERRAWHLASAAGHEPDEEAASALEHVAGMAAARGDLAAASRALGHSARVSRDPGDGHRRILRSGVAGCVAGLPLDPFFVEALQRPGDEAARAEAVSIVFMTATATRRDWSPEAIGPLIEGIARSASPPVQGALTFANAGISFGRQDPAFVPNLESAWAAMGGAIRSDNPGSVGMASFMAFALCLSGRPAEAVGLAGEVEAVMASGVPWPLHHFVFPVAFALTALGQPARALTLAEPVLAAARRAGALVGVCWCQNAIAAGRRWTGDLDGARSAAEDARELAGICDLPIAAGFADLEVAWNAAVRGDDDHAQHALADARAWSPDWRPTLMQADVIEGQAHSLAGRLDDAARALADVAGRADRVGCRSASFFPALPGLVDVLVRLGRTEEASAYTDLLEERIATTGGPWVEAVAARCRGLLAPDEAIDALFGAALAHHARSDSRVEEARTRMLYGERLRRARRRTDARAQLEAALAIFERVAARPWAERCRTELRASGARIAAPSSEEGAELTAQEYQVAVEVAKGQSNADVAAALFISRKTVEMHLTRVYRKLGVRTRAGLVRWMMEAATDA